MAGKKRTRNKTGGAKGKATTSSPATAARAKKRNSNADAALPELPSSPLLILLSELRKLALDAALCQKILQALADGTAPVLNVNDLVGVTGAAGDASTAASVPSLSSGVAVGGGGGAAAAIDAASTNSTAASAAISTTAVALLASNNNKGKKKKKRARLSKIASTEMSGNEDSTDPVAKGGFWILLATHVLNRLLASLDNTSSGDDDITNNDVDDDSSNNNNNNEKISQVISLISYFLARILLPIKSNNNKSNNNHHDRAMQKLLERACSNRAKSLLGRAVLSITVGATSALEQLASATKVVTPGDDDDDNEDDNSLSLSLSCWIPATLALDVVVRLSRACPKAYSSSTGTAASAAASAATATILGVGTTTAAATASPVTSGGSPTAATAAGSPMSVSMSTPALSSTATASTAVTFWNQSQTQLEDAALRIMLPQHEDGNISNDNNKTPLETVCDELSRVPELDMVRFEIPCLVALLGITASSTTTSQDPDAEEDEASTAPPAAKRAGSRRKSSRAAASSPTVAVPAVAQAPPASESQTTASLYHAPNAHPLVQAFHALILGGISNDDGDKDGDSEVDIHHLNTLKMDGRVAAKRWSSMALIWLMQGQRRVLESMRGILLRRVVWDSNVWNINNNDNAMEVENATAEILLPGNVALVALVTRLAGVLTETHTQSGSRAPSGGLDAYVRAILPSYHQTTAAPVAVTVLTSPAKKAAKNPKACIPDLRSIATIVLYHLLQAHEDCLEVNHQGGDKSAIRLVNDEDHDNHAAKEVANKAGMAFNPGMRPVVEGLCRVASATTSSASPGSSNYVEQALGQERLQKIASVFIMQNVREDAMPSTALNKVEVLSDPTSMSREDRPLDVQLVRFALAQFNACLEKAELNRHIFVDDANRNGTSDSNEYKEDYVVSRYSLLEPVPVPDMATPLSPLPVVASPITRRGSSRGARPTAANSKSIKTTTPSVTTACSYASILVSSTSKREPQEDDLLSLFVRSMVPFDEGEDNKKTSRSKTTKKSSKRSKAHSGTDLSSPATKLYSTLLGIVRRAYAAPLVVDLDPSASPGKPGGRATKRAAPTAKGQGRKRRKTNEGSALIDQTERPASEMQDIIKERLPLNSYRAALAEEANTVLNRMVTTLTIADARYSSYSLLRKYMRLGFSGDHLVSIVGLTKALDELVIVPRTAIFLNGTVQRSASGEPRNEPPDASDFAVFEKSLWLSNLNLCTTIGQEGSLASIEERKERILRTPEMRLAAFRAISSWRIEETNWPLWLPPALRALVSNDIANQVLRPTRTSSNSETAPEMLIANGFVLEIIDVLQEWEVFPKANRFATGGSDTVDYGLPLSIQDARLFLIAIGRLSPVATTKLLAKLLSGVRLRLDAISANETAVEVIRSNREFSSLIARIVIVCSNFTCLVAYPELQEKLHNQVRQSHLLELPGYVSECDWYRRERSYVGVFTDWESSKICTTDANETISLSSTVTKDLSKVLEHSLALGFQSARSDRGHLLFASWNAIGNKPLWEPQLGRDKSKGNPWDGLLNDLEGTGITKVITQIREDCVSLHVDMEVQSGRGAYLPLAAKRMQSNDQSANTIKKGLKSVVANGEKILASLLLVENTSPALFSSLEAAAMFISFGIASHSKPSSDDVFASVSQEHGRRPRGYSSDDSEREGQSDLDSVDSDSDDDDPSSRLRERLQSACGSFGAAPTHPDWLDESCTLQFGVIPSEALDVARLAVRTLSNMLSTCQSRHYECLQKAVNALRQSRAQDKTNDSVLAGKLLLLVSRYRIETQEIDAALNAGDEDGDYQSSELLAALFNLEVDSLDLYISGRTSENLEETKAAWCPNSAQRILGRFQESSKEAESPWLSGPSDSACSLPELRVEKQWEVLLATSLATACRDALLLHECDYSEEAHKAFQDAEFWYGACETAVSCLMPVAALLRFGLERGGRKTHPLAIDEEESTSEVEGIFQHFHVVDRLPISVTASKQLRETISETLAVLAQYSAQCAGDIASSLSCHAVASNLLIAGESFEYLRAFEASRFALTTLSEINETCGAKRGKDTTTTYEALQFFNRHLVSIIDYWCCDTDDNAGKSSRLMDLLCHLKGVPVDTIAENDVAASSVLASLDAKAHTSGLVSRSEAIWLWDSVHENSVFDMVSLLWKDRAKANLETRSSLSRILKQLAFIEFEKHIKDPTAQGFIVSSIVKAFNSMTDVKELLSELCVTSVTGVDNGVFQKEICSLMAFLVSDNSRHPVLTSQIEVVLQTLGALAPSWLAKSQSIRHPILDLLLLFSCSNGSLAEVGSLVLKVANEAMSNQRIESIERFVQFVRSLRTALNQHGGESNRPTSVTANAAARSIKKVTNVSAAVQPQPPPRACSFNMKKGFHGQHWYNCNTCSLTWDRGCCTLCALICHEGHDVSYSRYSSFFCDCGADDGNQCGSEARVSCKCLSTVPEKKVQDLFRKEGWPVELDVTGGGNAALSKDKFGATEKLYMQIAKSSFPKSAASSVDNLIAEGKKEEWIEKLFEVLKNNFEAWSSENCKESALDLDFDPANHHRYECARQSLHKRIGKVLSIEKLTTTNIVPIRAAKSNSFQVKFSGSINEQIKRSKQDMGRSAVVADSRGRLVIAEPCSLLFCSAAASVNLANVHEPSDLPLTRATMCILGSCAVSFNIVGMKLCDSNDRHLIVWGASEASVVLLKETHDGTERQIVLSLDLDPAESDADYVMTCHWVPGSQTCIAVGCGRFISIFDISRADSDNRALPIISFGLGFESDLKDIAILPGTRDKAASLLILLENGRLYCVDLEYGNKDGKLTAPGEQQLESGESILLPTAGVRAYQSAEIGAPGAHSHTLGDGAFIFLLKQANVLLYKCTASCVLALTRGATGKINGSFELLPNTLSAEMLGSSVAGYSIGGPYTHWTELGQSYDIKGDQSFRVSCVGRSFQTNQPKLLCIEFNAIAVRVKEVGREMDSIGLGLSLYSSFEGLCAFSLPFRVKDAVNPDSADGSSFSERAYLCAVTSSGGLLLYGEENGFSSSTPKADTCLTTMDLVDNTDSGETKKKNNQDKLPFLPDRSVLSTFPITLFERLVNVSENFPDEVLICGEALGCDSTETRRKLSRDNSVFFMSPRREGVTLAVSLGPNSKSLAIMGVRFQCGASSLDCIPQKMYVQGRPVDILHGQKKWYSISLNEEEVLLTLRSGFLSITMGPAYDETSSSILDSFEVYALEKQSIDWLPRVLCKDTPVASFAESVACLTPGTPETVAMACRSLEALCEVLGPPKLMPTALLKRMVQSTTVHYNRVIRESVHSLLGRLYSSPQALNSVKDEGALQGCALLLNLLVKDTEDQMSDREDSFESAWFTIRTLLHSVLRTASNIARCRPINYLRGSDVIASAKISSGSIAFDSSKLISEGIKRSLPCEDLCELFVELSLAESAIGDNIEKEHQNLASFLIVRKLLESSNLAVVERSCHAISTFCKSYGTGEQSKALHNAKVVCYQCDSCGQVPIKGVRYVVDDTHDVDLCNSCFQIGHEHAKGKGFGPNSKVTIDGKIIDLSCALIKDMQPVPIVKADVTEVMDIETDPNDAADENEELQKALRLSLGDNSTAGQALPKGVDQSLEDFVDSIFSSILTLVEKQYEEQSLGLILTLLISLVHNSSEQAKLARAIKLAQAISLGAGQLAKASKPGGTSLILCLRSLAYLISPHNGNLGGQDSNPGETSSDKGTKAESKQVVCGCGVPAVKRRCARGEFKNRRFHVCGLERSQRCKFFVWSDQVGQKTPMKLKKPKSQYDKDLAEAVWRMFSLPAGSDTTEKLLCKLLEGILDGWRSGANGPLKLAENAGGRKDEFQKLSLYDNRRALQDFSDGVFCSHEKLRDFSVEDALQFTDAPKPTIASTAASFCGDGDVNVLEACLKLLSLLATGEPSGISIDTTRWFSILCEIIGSPNKSSSIRSLAKRLLKQLCAGKKDLYHSVRDHFILNFQMLQLLQESQTVLRSSILLKEKARQGGPHWKSGHLVGWAELTAGGLIGSDILLSEDCTSLKSSLTTGKILDELWNTAKNRNHNWKRFCGLNADDSVPTGSSDPLLGEFKAPAPIVSLVWIACALVGSNQAKALRLVDLALTSGRDPKKNSTTKHKESISSSDFAGGAKASTAPEDILLYGDRKLDAVRDLHAFLIHFACMGNTMEVRRIACSIASKLFSSMRPSDVGLLLSRLLCGSLGNVGWLGLNSVEFLNLVQMQLTNTATLPMEVKNTAKMALENFKQQFQAIKFGGLNGDYVEVASGVVRRKFDLSRCIQCQGHTNNNSSKDTNGKHPESRSAVSRTARTQATAEGNGSSTKAISQLSSKREWLPTQVSPYARGRLDSSKESTTNDAFCSFRQLKHRVALSEIHVNVNDPRGRFVKSLTVYFTARPVDDVQILKSDSYLGKWQQCATLNLPRGASQASCTLAVPVTVANLKIEYSEFFDRPGSGKSTEGCLLVHCPRCTRVVNNAHGVCGNCGEVAFQCRKCRHINYDQLQSFLCVECGFCSAGSFSFDLVAGVASNAVAITNDDDHDRFVRMHNTATRLNADLREALKEKIRALLHLSKSAKVQCHHHGNSQVPNPFTTLPGLRRAFHDQDLKSEGPGASAVTLTTEVLLDKAGKRGWTVKMIATPGAALSSNLALTPSGTTASLLQLARQLRTEGSRAAQSRRRAGDVLVRQVGRSRAPGGSAAVVVDSTEEETDLLSLLEASAGGLRGLTGATAAAAAGAGGILDSTDPLSRLLTSFQTTRTGASQARANSGAQDAAGASGSDGQPGGSSGGAARSRSSARLAAGAAAPTNSSGRKQHNNDVFKVALEECEKLYSLMRETEKEAHAIKIRIDSWKRLERDELADRGDSRSFQSAGPSLMGISEDKAVSSLVCSPEASRLCASAFLPSHCSGCSSQVAVQLLLVWLRLFQADPAGVAISQDSIEMLLEESHLLAVTHAPTPPHGGNTMIPTSNNNSNNHTPANQHQELWNLMEWKRHVVREIAVKAPVAISRLVLEALAKRLKATRDVASAEILGSIIRTDDYGSTTSKSTGDDRQGTNSTDHGGAGFELEGDYVNLAMEVLQHESIL